MDIGQPLLGLFVIVFSLYGLSEARQQVSLRLLTLSLAAQFALALIFLNVELFLWPLKMLGDGVGVLGEVTQKAAIFMFGYLAGGPTPFEVKEKSHLFIIAFQVLPLIMVISALAKVLYHWRIIPWIIQGFALALKRILRLDAPLSFGAASCLFFGTIEAPLLLKPYLNRMSRSNLFGLLSCSMATISGSVMVLYANLLEGILPHPFSHLVTASLISIPSAILLAKIWIPEEANDRQDPIHLEKDSESTMDALVKGTFEGLDMVLKISALIVVFFALVYLGDRILALAPLDSPLTLTSLLGFALRPVMWLIGIPWSETPLAGELMANKVILNEFVAFLKLAAEKESFSPGSIRILTYAFCGFANLASVGIIAGGLTALMPDRRQEWLPLCLRSLLTGNLATLMTAQVIALLQAFRWLG